MQNRNAAFHSEAGFASVARIEEKGGTDRFAERLVSMAEDYDVRTLPIDAALK